MFFEGNFRAWQFLVTTEFEISVQRCLFSNILSSALVIQDRESTVTVENCELISNGDYSDGKGGNWGGAISSYSTLTIKDSNFVDNIAFIKGGAVFIDIVLWLLQSSDHRRSYLFARNWKG